MNSSLKIYILMATYNGEKYLSKQLDSLLVQTYGNWKLYIHDDNSSDKTVEIIKEYQNRYPERIVFFDDNVSSGTAKENFTYLLKCIDDKFDYLMFCDQDDVWLDDKVELTLAKMLEVEKKYPQTDVLIHSDLKVVDADLNIISDSMFEYQNLDIKNQESLEKISMQNIVTGCTMMINKDLYQDAKEIPKEAMMHDWWIAIVALKKGGVIKFLDKSTILYRQHGANSVGSKKVNLSYYLLRLLKIKEILQDYGLIYQQYKKAGVDINIIRFIFSKLFITIKKVLK